MTTPATDLPPQPPASPSSAAPGTPTPSPSAPPAEFRYGTGADVPAWARGKSASEVLGMGSQMAGALESIVRTGAPSAPAAPAAPHQPPAYTPPGDDEYVSGKDARAMAEFYANRGNGDMQAIINSNAEIALDIVKREYSGYFAKYGPSINATLANVPDKRLWTVDNLRRAVKLSLVDHVDEIAREKAGQLAAEMEPTLRSTGAGGPPISPQNADYTLSSEKLPSDWKKRAGEVGLTLDAVDEFCRANDGMTRESFFKQFESTAITERSRRG